MSTPHQEGGTMNPFPENNKQLNALLVTGILAGILGAVLHLLGLLGAIGGYSSPLRALVTENALGEQVFALAPIATALLAVAVLFIALYLTASALMVHTAHLALERERLHSTGS